jgi:putative heme-binding domain-containing protein
LAGSLNDNQAIATALGEIGRARDGKYDAWQFASLGGFLDALDRRNLSLKKFRAESKPEVQATLQSVDTIFSEARKIAEKPTGHAEAELQAVLRLLGRGLDNQKEDVARLGEWLHPQMGADLQKVAVNALGRLPGADAELLKAWKAASPGLRGDILNALSARQDWIQSLLTAVESGKISAIQIGTVYQQKLMTHNQSTIRDRAAKVFAARNADRQKLVKEYEGVADLVGNPNRGAGLFRANCSICHRLKGEGAEIGPDLSTVADKPVDVFLNAILDPNQAVEARYLSYTAVTKSGREVSGILVAETPNSLTLKNSNGNEEAVLRSDLKELIGSGLSLMPEGFENAIKPQDMADLISYIKGR